MQKVYIPSSSSSGVVYEVVHNDDCTSFTCNCPAGSYNKRPCKHVKRVMLSLGVALDTDDLTDSEVIALAVMKLENASDVDTVGSLKTLMEKEYPGLLKRVIKATKKHRVVQQAGVSRVL